MFEDDITKKEKNKYLYFSIVATIIAYIFYYIYTKNLTDIALLHQQKLWISFGFVASILFAEKFTIRPNENTAIFTSYYFGPAMASVLPYWVSVIVVLSTYALSFVVFDDTFDQKLYEYKAKVATMLICIGIAQTAQLLTSTGTTRLYETLIIYSLATIIAAVANHFINLMLNSYYYAKKVEHISQGIIITCAIIGGILFSSINGQPPQYFLGVGFFYIPIILLWQSFNRLILAQQMFTETINSLSKAAEYAGYIPVGHCNRVKNMALETAKTLSIPVDVRRDLATASLLCDISVNVIERHLDDETFDWKEVADLSAEMLEDSTRFKNAQWIITHYMDDSFDGSERTQIKLAAEVLAVSKEWDKLKYEYKDDSIVLNRIALEPHGKYNKEIIKIVALKKGLQSQFLT